jgi:hypothetical protein
MAQIRERLDLITSAGAERVPMTPEAADSSKITMVSAWSLLTYVMSSTMTKCYLSLAIAL